MPAVTSLLAAAAIAATAGSAISQADQARRAQHAIQDAANKADPSAGMRPQFQQWLGDNWDKMISPDVNSIMASPDFQFAKEDGLNTIKNNTARDIGSTRSGTYGDDMAKFYTGLQSQFVDKQFARNMAALGLAGNYAGLTTGNPGMAGQLTLAGNTAAGAANENMWGQIGGGIQYARSLYGNGGGGMNGGGYYGGGSAGEPGGNWNSPG